jgi:hypothetical protein
MLIGSVFEDGNTPPLELIDQEKKNPTAGNSHFFSTRCVALCHYLGIVQYIAYNFDVYRTRFLAHCCVQSNVLVAHPKPKTLKPTSPPS